MDDTGKKEYKLVTEKRTEMKDIFKRMDDDEDIYLLEPYEMYHLPPHDTRKVDDVVNVTLPDPLTFARKAIDEQRKGKTSVILIPVQSYVNLLLEAGAERIGTSAGVQIMNDFRAEQQQ